MASFSDLLAGPTSEDERLAVVDGLEAWSRAALRSLVEARVAVLEGQGLAADEVVLAPASPAFDLILMQFALARLGSALMPYLLGASREELRTLAAATGAEWLWSPAQRRLEPTGQTCAGAGRNPASPFALLVKTSGSSGAPKVAMLTAQNLLASATHANARLGFGSGDLWLGCLRMTHVGGLSIPYRAALGRGALLQCDGFDAAEVDSLLRSHPVTHISLVPPMLGRLLDLNPAVPPRLRAVLLGGQAAGRALVQRAVDAGWPLHLSYGMTETGSQIATTDRLAGEVEDCRTAGLPNEGLDVDAVGCGEEPRPLRLRGPTVMAGYANPERSPGQGLDDGWFQTADLGCLTSEGELKIFGRADDVVVVGGTNVSTRAVEDDLSQAPSLREVVVIGIDDALWGSRLAAVYAGDIEERSLAAWCSEHFDGERRPRAFLRLPALPLLESGKYDRLRIRRLVEQTFPST